MKSKDTGHMKSPTKTNVLTPPTKIEIVHSTYNRSNGSCKKLPSKEFFTHKQNRQQNMGPSCEKGDFKRFFTSSWSWNMGKMKTSFSVCVELQVKTFCSPTLNTLQAKRIVENFFSLWGFQRELFQKKTHTVCIRN